MPPASFTATLKLTGTMFYLLFVVAVVLGLMLLIAWFSPRSPGFRRVTGGIYLLLTLGLVAYPLFTTVWFLMNDAGLRGARPSTFAFSLHRSLSTKLPDYINRRIESKVADTLNRAGGHYNRGTRVFLLVLPFLLWPIGPDWFLGGVLVTLMLLYRFDYRTEGLARIAPIQAAGDFEATLTWVVGLRSEVPFRVQELQDPPRIEVDCIRHGD